MLETIKKILNETYTENDDVAYKSTNNFNLDFFGVSGALRNNQKEAVSLFKNAYNENQKIAIKNLFYLRDIREGLGERETFRTIFRSLIKYNPKLAMDLLPYIPEIGRYDDLFVCVNTVIEDKMIYFIKNQLDEDIKNNKEGKEISLLSKWMPSINASKQQSRELAEKFAKKLGYSKRNYRKTLSELRKGRIIENNLRIKDYTFDYSKVPSVAMHKYRKAFYRNDYNRYCDFFDNLNKDNLKVNTNALYPYQIIKEYNGKMDEVQKKAMQAKWDNFKLADDNTKTIVVRDGSGSMTWSDAIYISTSLAILFANNLSGEFKNKFITFSSEPKLVELNGKSLYDDLSITYKYEDYTNTDITKVYDLIIDVISRSNFDKEDMIDRIVIISDMEFDGNGFNVPTYDVFRDRFKALGYEMPEIVFWNVCARNTHFASFDKNIKLVSGASQNVINSILENNVLNGEEYMNKVLEKYNYLDYLWENIER